MDEQDNRDVEDTVVNDESVVNEDMPKDGNFEFITETIKEKPISKKRILGKILFTMFLAVLFGLIAGVTFLIVQPHLNILLYREETQKVEFPQEEEPSAEIPEATVEEIVQEEEKPEQVVTQIVEKVEKVELEIEDYKLLSEKLYGVATEAGRSIVTVTGLSPDVDWFMNAYENQNQTSGMILADNGKELLILANKSVIEQAETIQVEFCDATVATGTIKKYDQNTGLAIVAVELEAIEEQTKEIIAPVKFGNTKSSSIIGSPVIAIGNPLGYVDSVAMGSVTSNTYTVNLIDTSMQLITTDIYGSKTGNGVLINLDGKVMGIICQEPLGADNTNLIKAYGISEVISTIEKLSNGQDIAYLGIKGTDVTESAHMDLGVPMGAYVTEVIVDSPAMQEGIQNGDVIIKIGTTDITSFADYKATMLKSQPGDLTVVTVKRLGKDGYIDLSYDIMLGTLE